MTSFRRVVDVFGNFKLNNAGFLQGKLELTAALIQLSRCEGMVDLFRLYFVHNGNFMERKTVLTDFIGRSKEYYFIFIHVNTPYTSAVRDSGQINLMFQ